MSNCNCPTCLAGGSCKVIKMYAKPEGSGASPCSADEWKPDYSVTPRRVVCAAMLKDCRIITGARHFDKVMRSQMEATEGVNWWKSCKQGFIDQFGDFMTREEAWTAAVDQEQIHRRCGGDDPCLYSENLY